MTTCAVSSLAQRALVLAACVRISAGQGGSDEDWPQWRGRDGSGATALEGPLRCDEESLRWSLELPGTGVSSPIVVGSRVFVTVTMGAGAQEEELAQERDGSWRPPVSVTRFALVCVDRGSGTTAWTRVLAERTPSESHDPAFGSHASASPVCDGERVYAWFRSAGLFACDLEGELAWSHPVGAPARIQGERGGDASPVLAGEALVVVNDHEGESLVAAFERETGRELWRRARSEPTTWATPCVVEHDGVEQVVVSGVERVVSYALDSGEPLWTCGGLGPSPIPSIVVRDGLALAMSGAREPRLIAIELGRLGDLTGTDAVQWSRERWLPYVPSPVVWDRRVFLVNDRGLVTCLELAEAPPGAVPIGDPDGSIADMGAFPFDPDLSLLRWPGMVAAVGLLVLISEEEGLYIPSWWPMTLMAVWYACRVSLLAWRRWARDSR